MKAILVLGSYLSLVATCSAQTVVAEYDWQKLAQNGQLRGGEAASVDGKSALKIVNRNETPLQLQLLKIPKPPISKKLYAITGEVRYDGIRGDGYLEMWNFFPPLQSGMPQGQYFSRTLGVGGEMGKLSGTSDWRAFMLPFDSTGGSVIGCLGGLLGWLAWKGQARRFVVAASWLLIGLGVALGLAAVVALSEKQRYAVWFPLVLGGVLLLGIIPFRLRKFLKHYKDLELRRMMAIDAMKG